MKIIFDIAIVEWVFCFFNFNLAKTPKAVRLGRRIKNPVSIDAFSILGSKDNEIILRNKSAKF